MTFIPFIWLHGLSVSFRCTARGEAVLLWRMPNTGVHLYRCLSADICSDEDLSVFLQGAVVHVCGWLGHRAGESSEYTLHRRTVYHLVAAVHVVMDGDGNGLHKADEGKGCG